MNMISNRKENGKIIELVDNKEEFLAELNLFLPHFLFYLWEHPKIMSMLLQNAEIDDIKNYLAPLIVNNFYENILSSYFIEENLIYILTILLQEEVNNLLYIEQNITFLDETCCGYLLEELRKKKDVQIFFKHIIIDAIENLETNYSGLKLNFIIDDIYMDYSDNIKRRGAQYRIRNEDIYLNPVVDSDNVEDFNVRDRKNIQEEQNNFNKMYIPFLDNTSFEKFVNKNKINTDKGMYNIYFSKLNEDYTLNNQNLYSNNQLLVNLTRYKNSDKLLFLYQNNFMRVVSFINSILDQIMNNLHILPYTIKCFCKIISILVTKKFENIKESEKIIFVSKFLFGKLLIPILKNPSIEAFINNFIISKNTLNNLQIISGVIIKFISGDFYSSDSYKTCGYTPFNWYFIENSHKIQDIYENAINVKLPKFIEDLINDKLSSDFEYHYFEQNKDEVINIRSICFNIHEIISLINVMEKCEVEIFFSSKNNILQKTFKKLISKNCKRAINDIINKENNNTDQHQKLEKMDIKKSIMSSLGMEVKETPKPKTKLYYFLITSLIFNDEYKKLFEISQPTKSFALKEIKDLSNETSVVQNNIIKVKNFICSLLFNFDKLVKTNFVSGTTENTEKILKELSILMKSSYFVIDGNIPFDWYINSIYEFLEKIPSYLTINDCEELYKEIERDVNVSLAQLDFKKLSTILEKLDFTERGKTFYIENQKLLMDIQIKENVQEIINEDFIPVKINFSWNEEGNGIFQIESCNFKEKDKNNIDKIIDYENSRKVKLALDIGTFITKFPDLIAYQEYQDANIIEIQQKLCFPENLNKYFEIVFTHLESNPKIKNENIKQIKENIYEYIMSKIHDKIFPLEPNKNDSKIFRNTVNLSWTQPKNFLKDKEQYVFGSFLKDIKKSFMKLETEKSIKKKFLIIEEIHNDISFFYNLNGIKNIGCDDIIPVLSYATIKVQPNILDSIIQFMKLYRSIGEFNYGGNQFEQLEAVETLILNIKYNNLNGVSADEFNEKFYKVNKSK